MEIPGQPRTARDAEWSAQLSERLCARGIEAPVAREVAAAVARVVGEAGWRVGAESDEALVLADGALLAMGRATEYAIPAAALSPNIVEFIRRGFVRVPRWMSLGGDPVVLFDFERLARSSADCMELTSASLADRLMESVAPAWDASRGRGVLAVRGLGRSQSRTSRSRTGDDGFERTLTERLRDRLAWCARARQWAETPRWVYVN